MESWYLSWWMICILCFALARPQFVVKSMVGIVRTVEVRHTEKAGSELQRATLSNSMELGDSDVSSPTHPTTMSNKQARVETIRSSYLWLGLKAQSKHKSTVGLSQIALSERSTQSFMPWLCGRDVGSAHSLVQSQGHLRIASQYDRRILSRSSFPYSWPVETTAMTTARLIGVLALMCGILIKGRRGRTGLFILGGTMMASGYLIQGSMALEARFNGPGSNSYDWCFGIASSEDGCFFLTGFSSATLTIWTLKITSSLAIVWQAQSASCAAYVWKYGVDNTTDGGCIVVGHMKDGCTSAVCFVYMIKYSAVGTVNWGQALNTESDWEPRGIKALGDDSYLIFGWTPTTGGFLARMLHNQSIAWVRTSLGNCINSVIEVTSNKLLALGSYGCYIYIVDKQNNLVHSQHESGSHCVDIVCLSDGNYSIVGVIMRSSEDYFVRMIRSDYSTICENILGGTGFDHAYGITELVDGSIVLAGFTGSEGAGSWDTNIVRVDISCNVISTNTYGGAAEDRANAITRTNDGGSVVVAGSSISAPSIGTDYYVVVHSYICFPGTFKSEIDGTCHNCSTGTYNDVLNASSCVACSAGQYQNKEGQIQCHYCPKGYYQNQTGQPKCKPCATGQYQNETRQYQCKDCPTGEYQNLTGQPNCSVCTKGTFQNQTGQDICKPCAMGQYQDEDGKIACKDCGEGTYQDLTGQWNCKLCDKGKYQNLTSQSNCSVCVIGTYQDQTGQSICKRCSAGTYQNEEGKEQCKPCPQGEFQGDTGRASCLPCEVGYYQEELGQTTCKPCSLGTYQQHQGQIQCLPCAIGYTTMGSIC